MGSCGEHGICTQHGEDGFRCICETGYEGEFCQQVKNHCHETECLNGGTCVSGEESFYCICQEGFSGSNCQFGKCMPLSRQDKNHTSYITIILTAKYFIGNTYKANAIK